jgi:iron complex outermembrane receptor protein
MLRSTPTTSLTDGGRLVAESRLGSARVEWGIDWQLRERNAILYNMDTGTAAALMYLWPGVSIDQAGLFTEATQDLDGGAQLKAGLRIDRVHASADHANDAFATPTPNAAYQTYYGVTAHDANETNLGGLLRYETPLEGGWRLYTGISRSVRTADATERYMNNWNMTPANRWIGNPALSPEKHHQIDAGLSWGGAKRHLSLSAWYDRVQDYILRDTARGQPGILLADGANVYRNVDAELKGIEIEASLRLRPSLRLSASAAWVQGDNTQEDRPLPQIPPLEGELSLDYGNDRWGLGSRLRFALEQERIDPYSAQEVGPTPGWQAVDLYGHYQINDNLLVRVGIDNLFDETYARHASRSNLLDPVAVRVNEPGRTLWLKASAMF